MDGSSILPSSTYRFLVVRSRTPKPRPQASMPARLRSSRRPRRRTAWSSGRPRRQVPRESTTSRRCRSPTSETVERRNSSSAMRRVPSGASTCTTARSCLWCSPRPTAVSTSPMLPDMSATPIPRPQPSTFAASAAAFCRPSCGRTLPVTPRWNDWTGKRSAASSVAGYVADAAGRTQHTIGMECEP